MAAPSASRDDVGSDRAQEALAGSRSVGRGPRPDRLLGRADRSRQIDRLRTETAGVVELAQRVADAEYRLNCLQRRSATGRQAAWAYVRELEQLPSRRSVPFGPLRSEATALVGAAVAQARLEIEIEERLDAEQRAVAKLRQRLDRMQAAVEVPPRRQAPPKRCGKLGWTLTRDQVGVERSVGTCSTPCPSPWIQR